MQNYTDDELLPISALQHYLFCPRRASLIHTEGLWAENTYTVEGTQLHERADDPDQSQNLAAVRIERAVSLCSYHFGLTGKADVIEFHRTEVEGKFDIHVIEYKRGKPKAKLDLPYQVQLCAQVLCVEDMLQTFNVQASIFYGQIKRRRDVPLDDALRERTRQAIDALHEQIRSGQTPLPVYQRRKCNACSLIDLCLPTAPRPKATASRYLASLIASEDDE